MPRKGYKPKEIIAKLRQVKVLVPQNRREHFSGVR